MFEFSWTGALVVGLLIAGAVGAGALGQSELALVLAGAVGGLLAPQPVRRLDV